MTSKSILFLLFEHFFHVVPFLPDDLDERGCQIRIMCHLQVAMCVWELCAHYIYL